MSLLIFAYRKLAIIRQKNELNYRLMQMNQKIEQLQQYASNIADGDVSLSDMMHTPASMFNRQLMFMTYAHNSSLMSAQQNMQGLMMLPHVQAQMQQMTDPNMQASYQKWIFENLYNQAREKAGKAEEKLLHQQEEELQKEKAKLETQLKLIEQEYEATKQAEDKAVQFWKPEYVA